MNNPSEQHFMTSPMSSRPPAQKKQRAGATPGSTSHTASVSTAAADGIARRRAELRRLQGERQRVKTSSRPATRGPPPTAAASNINASATQPPAAAQSNNNNNPPMMKPAGVGRHYSDLFPTVPKSPSPMVQRETLLEVDAVSGTTVPSLPDKMPASGPPPTAASTSAPPKGSGTPAVNRKLEFNASQAAAARAKSAPRARAAPPPPPSPARAYEAPPAASASSAKVTARPTPVSPTRLAAQKKTTSEIKKKQAPKTPHMIPSSRLHGVSNLAETTPEPADLPKKKNMPAMATPHPGKAASQSPATSSSSKRDTLNAMRKGASVDAPPTPARKPAPSPPEKVSKIPSPNAGSISMVTSATAKRLEETLQKTQQEKTQALIKVKELEDKLLMLQAATASETALPAPGTSSNLDLNYLFTLAETDGPVAAIDWAKQYMDAEDNSKPSQKMANFTALSLDTPVRRRISARTATPHPKLHASGSNNAPSDLVQLERQLIAHFREAAHCVPFEFSSKLATYTVRRPYGMMTPPERLFEYCSPVPHDAYSNVAHCSELQSLEVAVQIHPDQSVLLLFQMAGVRYKIASRQDDDEWTTIQNVDDDMQDDNRAATLGMVSYIDEQANELEYSLDEILEEALLVREQYASTMISTALGFEKRPPVAASTQDGIQKTPSKDVGVETDEKGMATDVPKTIDTGSGNKSPPIDDSPPASTDVLTMFFSWIVASLLGLIYFVVVGLPLKIVQTVFIMTVAYCIFNMLYFYLAQDYNDWVIAENGGSVSMSDLVSFSNAGHGIM